MRGPTTLAVLCALSIVPSRVAAQSAPTTPPAPEPATPSSSADRTTDPDDAHDPDQTAEPASAAPPASETTDDDDLKEAEVDTERWPPPGPPSPADQKPAPVLDAPPPDSPMSNVEVGAQGGIVSRPAATAGATYDPAWTIGGHARVELSRLLGARLVIRHESSTATARALDQTLELDRLYIGAVAEPTWPFADRWLAWGSVGIAWARTTAESTALTAVRDRVGVFVEVPIGLGLSYEIVPNWVRLTATGHLGLVTLQSGDMFTEQQGIDPTGMLTTVPALPRFGTSWTAVAGIGVLL